MVNKLFNYFFDKVNFTKIITNHYGSLVNANTRRHGFSDWFSFTLFPLAIATIVVYFYCDISKDTINIIITVLSIFVGFLINVIVLIFGLIDKEKDKDTDKIDIEKIDLLQETISNIAYSILVSLITIGACLLSFVDPIKLAASFIVYFLSSHFIMTLLMVIKRMYLLFINDASNDLPTSATKE